MQNVQWIFSVLFLVFTSVSLGQSARFQAQSLPLNADYSSDAYKKSGQILHFKDIWGEEVQVLTARFAIPATGLADVFKALPQNQKGALLFSYNENLLQSFVLKNPELILKGKKNYLLPFTEAFTKPLKHLKKSVEDDQIGLSIVVFNTAYDSYIWMHADALSSEQKTAMVTFNVMLAAAFGLDKDLFVRMTTPLKNRMTSFLDQYSGLSLDANAVGGAFLANMVFSTALQSSRLSILSYPQMTTALSSTYFWGTSLAMGALMTFNNFSWSEQLASVDQDRHPIAKKILRRFVEIRSVFMGQFASSSRVLQPDVYGFTPIATNLIHGALGLWVMLNSSKIVDKIEQNEWAQRFYRFANQTERVTHKGVNKVKSLGSSCRNLLKK